HHELSLPEGADHFCPGGAIPPLAHLFAGVAAPALDVSVARKTVAVDLPQLRFVQERFRRAVDVAAVIEHETGPIGVTEIFEACDFEATTVLSSVQIIDHVIAVPEPNEVEIKFVPHGFDQADQVLIFLWLAVEVTLFVNEPGNRGVWTEAVPQLLGAESRGANEIRPPMI